MTDYKNNFIHKYFKLLLITVRSILLSTADEPGTLHENFVEARSFNTIVSSLQYQYRNFIWQHK